MPETLQQLPSDQQKEAIRLMRRHLAGFYTIYLKKDTFLPMADFHKTMCMALEDPALSLLEVMGFRGSAKSTIGSLALPLWAALEHPELYQFIIIIADSSTQAALNIAAIKHELEYNELLKADYGDMRPYENEDDWQARNIVLKNGVRIMARSRGQKVRGIRHREHRPKLIIVDDPEDLEWIQQEANRQKSERWFLGEVVPATDARQSKIVLIGNMLHNDALLARVRKNPLFKIMDFPLVSDDGVCAWPQMYPTKADLDRQHNKVGEIAWQREYMLKVVSEEGQDIKPEDIHYYDELPFDNNNFIARGVDLAISTEQTADYTAVVSGEVTFEKVGDSDELRIYVLPHPLIRRMTFTDSMTEFNEMRQSTRMGQTWYVEQVAFQQVAIEEMERRGYDVIPMRPTRDKRSRLRVAARYIKNGTVLFPREGCELLLTQLFGFGTEKHDDAVDSVVYMILGVATEGIVPMNVEMV